MERKIGRVAAWCTEGAATEGCATCIGSPSLLFFGGNGTVGALDGAQASLHN